MLCQHKNSAEEDKMTTSQVSHGLNLALPLDPAKGPFTRTMAKILAEVVNRSGDINGAIDQLGTVYFARFVPTPDNSALLFLGEIEVPAGTTVEAGVVALAEHLGFLFDAILPWMLGAPQTPVAQHPDEFAAFIRNHKDVRIIGTGAVKTLVTGVIPDLGDYPLYCAYPRKTVAALRKLASPGAPLVPTPISHGLNLVLTLQTRVDMPLLLLEILRAQSKIEQALTNLGFVHFARFLPTPDNTALLVITEFDGPLEPYVMDFAIAIGDVFTTVLRYVRDAPRLPVHDAPDDFWRFVKKNNRVRFDAGELHALLPSGVALPDPVDYPMYRAYPRLTVLDIVGPRAPNALLPPVPDHQVAVGAVDLSDVQGNILRGYRATVACHFVASVSDPQAARAWFAGLARGPAGDVPALTPAVEWTPATKPAVTLNVGFTFAGLHALQVPVGDLARFPEAFQQGPAAAARAQANGDVDESAPERWLLGRDGDAAHLVLSLHAYDDAAYAKAAAAIRAAVDGAGLVLLSSYEARSMPDDTIHFGYRDGIAQPRIAGVPSTGINQDEDFQPASSPGEFLLNKGFETVYGSPSIGDLPPGLATNGTFCVVRLLQQHVDAFEKLLDDGSAQLGIDRELLAAKLLGRWRTGQPLSKCPVATLPQAQAMAAPDDNAFDYAPSYAYQGSFADDDGKRCPMGAHIRRANPRSGRVAGVPYSRRLIRRGMPASWKNADGAQELGLFGLFMCGDIVRQFEFIQQQWLHGDLFGRGVRGTQDPLTSAAGATHRFDIPGIGAVDVPRLVTTRGSLYLFVPGLAAIAQWHAEPAHAMAALAPEPAAPLAPASLGAPNALLAASLLPGLRLALGGLKQTVLDAIVDAIVPVRPVRARPTGLPDAPLLGDFDPQAFDAKSPVFISNPYPDFALLRQCSPVHWVPEHGAFWVLDHADVVTLCTDPRFLKVPEKTSVVGLFTMDPPRHTEVRGFMNGVFHTAIADAASLAAGAAKKRLDAIQGSSFDLVRDFASLVPRDVLFTIAGIAEDDWAEVDTLARTIMHHQDNTLAPADQRPGHQAGLQLSLKLAGLLAESLVGKPSTLLHQVALHTNPFSAEKLSPVEAVMTMLQFILGGYLSTEFLICTGTRNLLANDRTAWKQVQSGQVAWPQAIDEMRRFDAPLGVIDRYASEPIAGLVPGFTIPAGSRFMALLGAANHDPAVFGAQADEFDITRASSNQTIALGWGIHRCIGEPLQAQVMPIVMKALMDRFPKLALASPLKTPSWYPDPYFRSFTELQVTI
jgi:cytochrome P450/deferrochelatase/peroxidase EfeB